MVSVLASGAVDRGFEPRSGITKDYNKIGYVYSAISCWEQINFQWNDDVVRFVLDQHT
jgi:hypothetical protein